MSRASLFIGWLAIVLGCVLSTAAAQEWPRFRGPNGSGTSDAKTIPVQWTESDYRWKAQLPGEGISSPVVWGDRLFITSAEADAGQRHLICLSAETGEEVWRRTESFTPYKKHQVNSFATSTPAVDEHRVYQVWQSKESSSLAAFAHDGSPVWKYELDPFREGHGGGVSPIVYLNLVVVACDQKGASYLLAVDRSTGKEIWKTPRNSDRAGYATPCVYRVDGRPDELIFSEWKHGITGIDPLTGKVRWEIDCYGDSTERAIASPIAVGDVIFATCGFVTSDKHCVAVRASGGGNAVQVKELFRIEKQAPHLPTPVAHGDRLFLWTEKGIASSVDLGTGKVVKTRRIGGNYSSSPICIDGRLYGISDDGDVVVLKADDSLEELARNSLGEASRATPAVSGGRLYLRTMSHVICIGG